MLLARWRRGETLVFDQIATLHKLGEIYPATFAQIRYAQGKIAVRHRNRLVANLNADKVLVKLADHEAEQRFLHGYYDPLSLSGAFARMQRRQDAAHHANPRGLITDADRFGARSAAVVPAGMRPTRHAIVCVRGAAVVLIRSRLAESTRTGIDQARIDFFEVVIAEAEFLHLSAVIVLDYDIGFRNQLPRKLDATRSLEI